MNQKTLTKLEFDKIIDLLAEEAGSFRGKQLCHRLKPMTDLGKINTFQEQTASAFTRIIRKGRISFGDAAPVEESMKRLEIGGALNISELLRIRRLLANTARVKSYGRHDTQEDSADCLDVYFDQLEPLTLLSSEIERCIISEDEISDDASSALKHIRRSISNLNGRVHTTLSGLVNGSLRTYLQDPIITMRGDRYCIPVKAEHRGQVQGLIHDQSSSGSTLFIEPMAVVKLNNDLKELYAKEQEEIQAILARLSEDAAQYIEEIRTDYRALTDLDFIFARGALALSMRGSRPVFNEEGRIRIREGRHPLLDQRSVVPITVSLGEDFTLLIITGPNTGGKTVSLKTVGLFTLMGQAGLHIPAQDRSELAVFRHVYADIGDEQSIEQSLSTFSSHMTNIVSFLKKVDERSLVLFDELGAGTDPTEGAALAIAILSYLHARGIRTMATTHYSELKVYALSTPGVENACCEFDVESLRPTYRLLIGIPGKSNAFAISSKLGLPDHIIADARKRLSEQDASFEDLLTDLETSRRTIEKEREEIAAYKREAESLKQQAAQNQKKLDEQRDRIIREANEKANAILREAKEVADETIRNFYKFGKENISAAEMEKERERIRKKIKDTASSSDLGVKKQKKQHKPSDFKLGESVKVLSMNLTGTISSLPDARGNVTVQMGILRSQVNISDLEIIEEPSPYAPKKFSRTSKGRIGMSKSLSVSTEINLLGKTVDEAVAELDKYLDDALLSHLNTVRVIHGKGTGALRKGIHEYLRRQKHVKSYHLAEFGEGDAGVTIVELG
ncbi:MAG TPA: endonuclease MutS2 [Candidatus Mediterraneibacter pullicola]|uniref:Endonuclease MutS2 n=1 Tax=Candidatus Mediterraneibacter pullicola TaxID=2838682 RepID=A0A9D2H6F9_9FIRM|nr:endonuclease MutS2 [Candidatus Mediterraneibacter pullicola]